VIQKMGKLKKITSISSPGRPLIEVEIKSTYDGDALLAIWTDLRAEVSDAARSLPSGVGAPFVDDGFGDVFGSYYAATAVGLSDAEIHALATFLRRELLAVEGVADVQVSGLPDEVIYVEPDLDLSINQNISLGTLIIAMGMFVDNAWWRSRECRSRCSAASHRVMRRRRRRARPKFRCQG